ncbi:hypothetical protein IKF03_01630, partial [Candidatus Saccharibacteria bacterium]|nr:hypothetical protein [Candidatus Saccharibacteria bacterium]
YHIVPSTYTKVATFPSVTDDFQGSSFKSTYRAYVSPTQPAGSYVGRVRYTMVHPNDAVAPLAKITLSDAYEKTGKTKVTVGSSSYYKLQDMTPEICNMTEVLDEGSQMQAIDIRDNKIYWITKLQDGKCWMAQNLKLIGPLTITPDNSDVSTNFSVPASAGGIWASGTYDATNANSPHAYYFSSTDSVYYNWWTSVAGSMNFSSTSGTAASSICPKNWKLPLASEHQALGNSYSNYHSDFIPASRAQLSGQYVYTTGNVANTGSRGVLWSSNPNSAGYSALAFLFTRNGYGIDYTSFDKVGGLPIRCVAR